MKIKFIFFPVFIMAFFKCYSQMTSVTRSGTVFANVACCGGSAWISPGNGTAVKGSINTQTLPQGIYFLVIKNNFLQSQIKFMKQ